MEAFDKVVEVFAAGLTVGFAWPQVFRAWRHGVEGISVGAIAQSLISASGWFGYGVATLQPTLMAADTGVVIGQGLVLIALVRGGAVSRLRALALGGASAAVVAIAQVGALTTPVVAGAGVLGILSAVTQLVGVVRDRDRLEGLSAATYGLLTALAVAWLLYGARRGDINVVWPNVVMLPISSWITYAAWRAHRHAHPPSGVTSPIELSA